MIEEERQEKNENVSVMFQQKQVRKP